MTVWTSVVLLGQCARKYSRFTTIKMATNGYNTNIRARNRMFKGFEKEKEDAWKGPFCFIQAADTQFGMIDSYLLKLENPGWEKEILLTNKAIAAANRMNPKPRFFIVCGDLIDALPGTALRVPQERSFKEVFADLDSEIPLICVCGNHDLGNTPTTSSIEDFKNKFGDDYFVFWCGGVMCIVLNSQYYEDSSQVQNLAEEQDRWLEQQLLEARSGKYKHAIIFQHIPWFLECPEEARQYFNIDIDIRMKMLKKFADAGIKTVFCGHYHRNAGGWYNDMELVVTSAIGTQLGKDASGMRVVRVLDNSIEHNYYSLDDIPTEVKLK